MSGNQRDPSAAKGETTAAAVGERSPQALRALEEAAARRKELAEREAKRPREIGGRGGHDPERYGDWEVKGLASDF